MVPSELLIDLAMLSQANLAAQQNAIPLVHQLQISNPGPRALSNVTVSITTVPEVTRPWEERVERIDAQSTHTLQPHSVRMIGSYLRELIETEEGELHVTISVDDEPAGELIRPLTVLPANQWPGSAGLPELLAAFVQPNHRALPKVLKRASLLLERHTASSALDGYQSRSPKRAHAIAAAVYRALQETGVSYITVPATFERHGQKVRTHDQVINEGMGNCLDLSVVLCALLEQCGLRPFIVMVEGHAFPGVWLTDFHLPTPVTDDPTAIRNRIRLDEALVFNSSSVAANMSFPRAIESGQEYLADTERFLYVLDIHSARQHGIKPITLGTPEPSPEGEAPNSEPTAEELGLVLPSTSNTTDLPARVAQEPESTRLQRWKDKLLDLTLRNRLLNFRSNRRTLELPHLDLAALEDTLANGGSIALRPRQEIHRRPDTEQIDAPEMAPLDKAIREFVRQQQSEGVLHTDHPPAEFQHRALELYRRSRSSFEESGAVTLYLGLGSLVWYESEYSDQERTAPLILVPMELVRNNASWRLQQAADEPRVNITLLKKLRDDFGLDVSSLETLPEDLAGVDVELVLRRFTRLAVAKPRWEVRESCVLAQFSFTKFLMWLDLEAKTEHLLENPVVKHIFDGKGEAFPLAADLVPLDRLDAERPPSSVLPVVSADPSQMQAVLAALDGSSFVLQGPPGTGKSQTITNLIATQLANGRSVLFVSEKMAALEVVQRRLDQVGLGPFCLELHSHQASKKEVMRQLAEALEAGNARPATPDPGAAERLEASRHQLNSFAEVLRTPTVFAASAQQTLSRLLGMLHVPRVRLPVSVLDDLTAASLVATLEAADDLQRACQETGAPSSHPLQALNPPAWSPSSERAFEQATAEWLSAASAVVALLPEVRSQLGLPDDTPTAPADLQRLADVVEALLASAAPPEALLQARAEHVQEQVASALATVQQRQQAWALVAPTFTERLLKQNLDGLRTPFVQWGQAFFLFAFFMLFSTRGRLKGYLAKGSTLPSSPKMVDVLDQAITTSELDAAVASRDSELRALLGPVWKGIDTDPAAALALTRDAEAFQKACLALVSTLPATAASPARAQLYRLYTNDHSMVAEPSAGAERLTALLKALEALNAATEALTSAVGAASTWASTRTLSELQAQVSSWRSALPSLRDWSLTTTAAGRLRALGMSPLVDALWSGEVASTELRDTTERSLLDTWWEHTLETEPRLRDFRGVDHEALIQRFQELDEDSEAWARQEVRARISARIPSLGAPGTEMALLKHQLQLQRRHKPLRQLFAGLPNLLRQLKPCVLMSPLSVAQFLDPSLPGFDVVVFDEASQIPPWDAVGAIARGNQVIVVGDSKQLPPTSFFHASDDGDDPLDDEDRIDLDSILDEAVGAGLPQHRLRWHYRSRHESLIAFSNHHYYDGKLRTFPSADHDVPHLGVHLHPVPDGFYDRGRSRTNRGEAEAIRDEVVRLLSTPGPRRTVGVVTFSMPQQRLIQDLLDMARRAHPHLESRFHGDEAPFVKNLENVQGDERDVILFSVGYGPDKTGKLSMNFGPLNKEGGERRLNVAITRARERVVLFSTLRADQIDLSRTRAAGVHHLKTYLDYAERGIVALNAAAATDHSTQPRSPLEGQLKAALEDAGHTVHCQVGVSGYRLGLAVVDPEQPGSYVLGVETDGPTYHDSAVARERDHLRDRVLEGLGWRIHRVWSADWWHARQTTTERLLEAVRSALAAQEEARRAAPAEAPVPSPPPEPATPSHEHDDAASLERIRAALGDDDGLEPPANCPTWHDPEVVCPVSKDEFHWSTRAKALGLAITELVDTYGPLDEEHTWTLFREAAGFGRLGKKIRRTLEDSLQAVPASKRPVVAHGALFPAGRDPAAFTQFRVPGDPRDIQQICLPELANAVAWVLTSAGAVGVDQEALLRSAARLMGTSQVGSKVRERLEQAVELLIEQGRASRDGQQVVAR